MRLAVAARPRVNPLAWALPVAAMIVLTVGVAVHCLWTIPPGRLTDKPNLGVLRLAHFVAVLVVGLWIVPKSVVLAKWTLLRPILVCGRYKGFDQRIIDNYVDEEISIGDFILSGGELAAALTAENVVLGKRRILELYLNVVEWGPGVYGAEAAARYHYSTSAAKIERARALRLAAILPAPLKRKPERMTNYASIIDGRMRQMGW